MAMAISRSLLLRQGWQRHAKKPLTDRRAAS
jgi:hypothetical protein